MRKLPQPSDKLRIRKLERALEELLEYMKEHQCPYCGTKQCPVTTAVAVLEDA